MRRSKETGFILPLAVLLVVVLTVSGTSFMHLDFLERRMGMNEVDNHGGFYLASAGIERARETLKIPADLSWTTMLNGTGVPANQAVCNAQLLCPDLSRGCLIPAFGTSVTFPDDLAFSALFSTGSYNVRAFNNLNDVGVGTNDTDQQLTIRACGRVRNDQKLLELTALAVSSLKLINCDSSVQASADCPDAGGTSGWSSLDGREPASFLVASLPAFDQAFYEDYTNFPTAWGLTRQPDLSGNPTLTVLSSNSYYFINGNVTLQNTGTNTHVVIFATGEVSVKTGVTLNDSIVIGLAGVRMNGKVTIRAPLPFPAIISGGTVHGNTGVFVYGTIYSIGNINLNGGTYAEGVIVAIGGRVELNGNTQVADNGNLGYYALMPGFNYPNDALTTVPVGNTWREIE